MPPVVAELEEEALGLLQCLEGEAMEEEAMGEAPAMEAIEEEAWDFPSYSQYSDLEEEAFLDS